VIRISLRRKLGLLAAAFNVMLALGAAANVSVNQATDTLHPSQNQTLATITVDAADNTTELVDTAHNFPFPVWTVNTTRNVTTRQVNNSTRHHTRVTAALVARPSINVAPEPRTNTVHVILPAESHAVDLSYTVAELQNWSITNTSFITSLSVGNNGDLGQVVIENTGNTGAVLDVNATRNITPYYDQLPADVSTNAGQEKTVVLQYQVPADTAFGTYGGQLRFTDDRNRTAAVNLSIPFRDERQPSTDLELPDEVMATTAPEWTVVATDNLDVATVTANVSRMVTVRRNNSTVQVNRSVGIVDFTHEAHTDQWTTEFTATENRGRYYANISVTDAAGNTVHRIHRFDVVALDAVNVLRPNFRMDGIRAQQQATAEVIRNTVESPFTLTLDRFDYGGNSSVEIGVIAPSADSPVYFDQVDDSKEFSETGTYTVVVESRGSEARPRTYQYDTVIGVTAPDQHVKVSDIVFRGQLISGSCPQTRKVETGGFHGILTCGDPVQAFEDRYGPSNATTGQSYAYVFGRVPEEVCLGDDQWGDCTDWSMGIIQDVEDANDRLRRDNTLITGGALLYTILLTVAGTPGAAGRTAVIGRGYRLPPSIVLYTEVHHP